MPQQPNNQQNSGFWFGMIMGGAIGSAALYFLGTGTGRNRLKSIIDTFENMEGDVLDELMNMLPVEDMSDGKKTVPTIHGLLDKIQSSIPEQKEVQKFFSKDGKILK